MRSVRGGVAHDFIVACRARTSPQFDIVVCHAARKVHLMLVAVEAHNFKSFGQAGVRIELAPLTILVGPNGSGKSSVLDAIALLAQSAPERSGFKWQGLWTDFGPDGQFAFNCRNTNLRLVLGIVFGDGESVDEWQQRVDAYAQVKINARTLEYRVECTPKTGEWRHEIRQDATLAAVKET